MNKLEEIKALLFAQPLLAENELFQVKVATTQEEIEEVYQLRYSVFTVEQGRNQSALQSGIDTDVFDSCCIHLIVKKIQTGKIVGTYRIHYGSVAKTSGLGFYSETEYDMQGFDKIAGDCMEMGRSCVAQEFRDGAAMGLLWKGVSELLRRSARRWLVGCVSLEDVSPVTGWGLYRFFEKSGRVSSEIKAFPKPAFLLDKPGEAEMDAFAADTRGVMHAMPPLLKGYMRLGAMICGEPAYDREFGSIDYFIVIDIASLPERYRRHFDVISIPKKD